MEMNFGLVNENVRKFNEEIKKLSECAKRFANTNSELSDWRGGAKDVFEEKIAKSTPHFEELVEVVNSYSVVAQNAEVSYRETDSQLIKQMMA